MLLSDRYDPSEVETRVYAWWENNGYFKASDLSTNPPYAIILPPPNVTGSLHLGHALDHTIQDCLIRWKRMHGFNALWLPGTDHAGIATQSVVERELKKQGVTRKELGRERFLKKVWEWKEKYGGRIVEQMKRLGDSCDWDRLHFTLDANVSVAVRRAFVHLYHKDWIYRGQRLVNWSPGLESAISDLVVEFKEVKGHLYHILYPLVVTGDFVVVATARPETLFGDVAVAVHPEDERYRAWVGQKFKLPLSGRLIPMITDESVDREFGTGVVKITPGHDFNDHQMGLRHKLPSINILNSNGTLNEIAGEFKGLKVSEARAKIVEQLKESGELIKAEPHIHQVGHCSRTGVVIEPFLSEQWFVRMEAMAAPAKRVVTSGTVSFEPASWTKTYLHWMNNIQDWCVSRQLWWGHRIPAWTCADCGEYTVAEVDPTQCLHCGSDQISQDEDVLDTWFSSGLWPFSTMGWPAQTEALKTFYPTNVLVTGHDIIFFWVARMIMLGLECVKDVPFRKVYIHGLVRDAQGNKMSKSLGNAEDPLALIEESGADALRFTILTSVHSGRDLKYSKQRLEGYRNFMNKIWNAARFSLQVLADFDSRGVTPESLPNRNDLTLPDLWLIHKLGACEQAVDEALNDLRFADAAMAVYSFAWYEFCDWYLEFIKPVVYGAQSQERVACQMVLAQVLNRLMRLLHPFAPFISEEIYQKLPIRSEALIIAPYPTLRNDRQWLELGSKEAAFELDIVRACIAAIRNIRGENRIKPGEKIPAVIVPTDDRCQKLLGNNRDFIITMAKLDSLAIGGLQSLAKCAVAPVVVGELEMQVVVPLEGLVDIGEEIKRIEKNIEKLQKELGVLIRRMGNNQFLENAPEDVVAQGKLQTQELKTQLGLLEAQLLRLQT